MAVAVGEAAVRGGQEVVQQALHAQAQQSRDAARVAEQAPAPVCRDALADHDPVRRLVQPHHPRMKPDADEDRRQQPVRVSPPPEQRQRRQRDQGQALGDGDPEQVPPRPPQAADVARHPQARQKHQQIVQRRQCADGEVPRPQMSQEDGKDRLEEISAAPSGQPTASVRQARKFHRLSSAAGHTLKVTAKSLEEKCRGWRRTAVTTGSSARPVAASCRGRQRMT